MVDQAVAFGLAKNSDDAVGIDPAGGNRRLDPGNIIGRRSRNAVDLGDRHVHPMANSSLRSAHPVTRTFDEREDDVEPYAEHRQHQEAGEHQRHIEARFAIIIRLPMPRLEATVSAITVPTNACVTATFNDAKK